MRLHLTNSDKEVLISKEDEELLDYEWRLGTHGYPTAWFAELKGGYPLHQIVMLRQGLASNHKNVIEHLNENPLDNRRENLRISSQTVNLLRAKGGGVRWHKQMQKWQVRLTYHYVEVHVGYFDDKELAQEIALLARKQLLQLIAKTENLDPLTVKLYFSKRKLK